MKNLRIRHFIYVFLMISVFIGYLIIYLKGLKIEELSRREVFNLFTNIAALDIFIWFIFRLWAWKLRIFRKWLVPFPNLQGTWIGHINSTWIDPDSNEPVDPISVTLVIKQTFTNLICNIFTEESESKSFVSEFVIDPESHIKKLSYSYLNTPKQNVRGRSEIHNGTALLNIIEIPDRKLNGGYWTERSTTGNIEVKYYSKTLAQEHLHNNSRVVPSTK